MGSTYIRQRDVSKTTPAFSVSSKGSTYDTAKLNNQTSQLNLQVDFKGFKPDKGLKAIMSFSPTGNLSANGQPKVPVCLSLQNQDFVFKAKEEMSKEPLNVPFLGDVFMYPFDTYTATVIIDAFISNDDKNCDVPLAINPTLSGTADGFVIAAQVFPGTNEDGSEDFSTARIEFEAQRTGVHRGFSMLMFIILWCLVLMLAYITLWTWKGGKRVEMGIVSMNSALLLAIPKVREAQPAIPVVGIVQDMYGYCYMILIIAVSLFSLQFNYVLRKERKKDVRKSREDGSTLLLVMDEILDDGDSGAAAMQY